MSTIPATLALAQQYLQAGGYFQAEQLFRQILEMDASQPDVWHMLGMSCQAQGKLADAEINYRRAVQLAPNHASAHNRLAIILAQEGKAAEALQNFQQALPFMADNADLHNNMAVVLSQLQQFDAAIASYRQALRLKPNCAEACYNLGLLLKTKGQTALARAQFEQALWLRPDYAEAANELGSALAAEGNLSQAVASYRWAIQINPRFAGAHSNLGVALAGQGDWDAALGHYREAVRIMPDNPNAQTNLGNALRQRRQTLQAAAHHREALRLRPDFAEAHANLGLALMDQGLWDQAIASFQQALGINPHLAEVHFNLGNLLNKLGRLEEALASFRQAAALQPDSRAALSECIHLRQQLCLWDNLIDLAQPLIQAAEQDAFSPTAEPIPPFIFLALPTPTSPQQQYRVARQWYLRNFQSSLPADRRMAGGRPQPTKSKITVGYLSRDFHAHATAYLIAELLEQHERQRFTILAYSYGPDDGSPMRRRLLQAVDRFTDVKDDSFAETAQRIVADGVDILVDLKGFTADARTAILALRPAPLQVNYLGYPGTMGAPFIDYVLVDDFVVPPQQQPFFEEKLVHLPGCYQVNDSRREIAARTPSRAECGLPEEGFVFCSFNNNYKITPQVFEVWMNLLKAVPSSVLWLYEGNPWAGVNLRQEAEARGVPGKRLVFAPRLPLAEHLARYRLADLFLDAFPYNAHTTCSDSLWVGCPVLTLAGDTFPSRVAGSLLRAIGLPELITSNVEDYRNLALLLAQNVGLLTELRTRLANNRLTSRLFDAGAFARALEKAYKTMWEIHSAGEKPRPFAVNAPC